MKRIFTLLLASFFSLSLLAYDGTRLSLFSVGSQELRVDIDGRRYNLSRDKALNLRNLETGNHSIRIYKEVRRGNGPFSRNRQELIFSQNIFLKRDHHLDITVNRFGKVMVDEQRISRQDNWFSRDEEDDYRDDPFSRSAISDREFQWVLEEIRKEWYEGSRLSTARKYIDKHQYNTSQVRDILLLFHFESNKLELAKYAYRQTVDTRNYQQLFDVFSHNSSKEELARFIRDRR